MDDTKCIWTDFANCFGKILDEHDYYTRVLRYMTTCENNLLLYGNTGFPFELFIDEGIKRKFNSDVYKKECNWNKDFVYYYNPNFIEIDIMNPYIIKNTEQVPKFILSIIQNKHVSNLKHLFVIRNIDLMTYNDFSNFRIIFERFSNNVYFICTTHKINKIDSPIQSRFNLFRMPNFTHEEIKGIFQKHLGCDLNRYLCEIKTRNVIKALFIAQVEINEPHLISKEFCCLNYPPLYEFVKSLDKKKNNLDELRSFSYKCFQYKIEIPELLSDLLIILPKKQKLKVINSAARLDSILQNTNKTKEPLYIECFLCEVLL